MQKNLLNFALGMGGKQLANDWGEVVQKKTLQSDRREKCIIKDVSPKTVCSYLTSLYSGGWEREEKSDTLYSNEEV